MICKTGVSRNFAKLLKKRHWHRCFPVSFAKFLRTLFLPEHTRWLFLFIVALLDYSILWLLFFTDINRCISLRWNVHEIYHKSQEKFLKGIHQEGWSWCVIRGRSRAATTSKMERFVTNHYHKALHLGCCSSPRSASDTHVASIYLKQIYFDAEIYKTNSKPFLMNLDAFKNISGSCFWNMLFSTVPFRTFLTTD